jgi:hypothetical protein
LILFAAYLWGALSVPYAVGERAGVLQRFARRGWICKTYEGELAMTTTPGVAPVIWSFTVREDGLAPQLNAALGQRVVLNYREHRGLPTSCFGETRFFVNGVRPQEEARTPR